MRLAFVDDVQIMRGANLLYAAPSGYDDDRLCSSCGERAPKLPCPHCGRPDPSVYVRSGRPRMIMLKQRSRSSFSETSTVFNPYLPELDNE